MDRDPVRLARRGEREAFALLARARGDWLFGVAQRIRRDFHRAEDAVRRTLVIAWQELRTLRDPDRFEPWLRRLIVRVCYVEGRRAQRWAANCARYRCPTNRATTTRAVVASCAGAAT